MPKITRRDAMKTVAFSSVLTQTACYDYCSNLELYLLRIIFLLLFGQSGSQLEVEIRQREEDETRLKDPKELAANTAKFQKWREGSATASVTGSAGGRAPQGGGRISEARLAETDPVRSFYLLDNLGDANTDGRVFAIDSTLTGPLVRGTTVLRVAGDPQAPGINATHIALSADGNQLLVSQAGTPAQWIFIDAAIMTITTRMMAPANVFPRRVAFARNGRLAYAIASNLQFDNTSQLLSVQILDTATHTIVGTIPLPAGTAIADWAITPDGGLLFGVGGRYLSIVDVASGTYSDRVDLTPSLSGASVVTGSTERLAIDPDGERLYALVRRFNSQNQAEGVVAVIDVRTLSKLAEYPVRVGAGTTGMILGLSPSGEILVAGFQRGAELQVFDTQYGIEVETIPLAVSGRLAGAVLA